jgi:hypothetical protein
MNIALDHLGILGADIHAMVAGFRALGFHVVGPAPLDPGTGADVQAQQSAHVMFADSYIELTAAPDCPPEHHLAPFIGLAPGIRLLVLACTDAEAERLRVQAAGLRPTAVHQASRQLAYGGGATAQFRWFGLERECLPGVLTGWVQHLTRAEVFDAAVMDHPNTVTDVEAVLFHDADLPPQLAAARGGIEARQEDGLEPDPLIGGLVLAAADLGRCRQVLEDQRVPCGDRGDSLHIAARDAFGAELWIRQVS